jgi:adenine-specific DNA-methyltransferase
MLAGPLGGESVHVFDADAQAFPDALSTAAITRFTAGRTHAMRFAAARDAAVPLPVGREVTREALAASSRWRMHLHAPSTQREDTFELGELCRVHRGAVTGCNALFITRGSTLPDRVLAPCITRARELFEAGEALRDLGPLRRLITLPEDLDALDASTRAAVVPFLDEARRRGVHETYVARKRRAWWSVALRPPAPILATYMARRPPAFVRNLAGAAHVNIAHGLYPREPLCDAALDALARYLGRAVGTEQGRTYAGGLTKFEPKEMERLRIPRAVLDCGCGMHTNPDGRAESMNPCAVSRVHGTVRRRGSGAKGP